MESNNFRGDDFNLTMTGANNGTETTYFSNVHEFTSGFSRFF
jgi:hypothetical protein